MLNILPDKNCNLCPRLCDFHAKNRMEYKGFHNAPVPSFGGLGAEILIVGLAPGLKGANRTGRPFTGDYAGLILYHALLANGLAKGDYRESPDDGLQLINCRITNAVRCVPPENKPEPSEIKQCNQFLKAEIAAMPKLKVILSLGAVSHAAVLRALGQKASAFKFSHGAVHEIYRDVILSERKRIEGSKKDSSTTPFCGFAQNDSITLINSYHTSRYNINTGTLTPEMFDAVVKQVQHILAK